jgi:hypothetical protein
MAYGSIRWTVVADANLDDAKLTKHAYMAQFVDVFHHSTFVYWSDDGKFNGTTVFSNNLMPYVSIMLSPSGQERDWQQGYRAGAMFRPQYMSALISFAWYTTWNSTNSIWETQIFRKGDPETNEGGADDDKPYLAYCSAIGLG